MKHRFTKYLCYFDMIFFKNEFNPTYGGAGIAIRKEDKLLPKLRWFLLLQITRTTQDSKFGGTIIVGAGIYVRITKNFFFNLDWRYDLVSHLPVAGLAYKMRLGDHK